MAVRARVLASICLVSIGLGACRVTPPSADDYVPGTTTDDSGPTTGGPSTAPSSTSETETESEGVEQTGTGGEQTGTGGEQTGTGGEQTGTGTDTGGEAVCGNGIVEGNEPCDDAGESAVCNDDCTLAECGDGVLNTMADEDCDDMGESALCDDDCTLAMCGDALVNMTAGEGCDDGGESASCNVDCTISFCPDGVFNATAGELCDEGGPTALCDADCTLVDCGDGFVNMAAGEQCDDAGESMSCDTDCSPAVCGDGLRNPTAGEACEGADLAGQTCASQGFNSGVLACDGACAFDTSGCDRPSCQAILDADPTAISGLYEIDVDGNGPILPFQAYCDMDTDGGGWTELTLAIGCTLGGEMVGVQPATTAGIDAECRPFTRDSGGEVHTYHYTIPFPPGFSQILPIDYTARANAGVGNVSDISNAFTQSLWTLANNAGGYGDISFGAAEEPGPVTSLAAAGVSIMCLECEIPYPDNGTIYTLGMTSQALRLGWGESGGESEGWYPWWSGTLRVR